MIDQGGHRFAEDPETARTEASPTEPAIFHPPVHGPSADVQNPGCFVDTEKPLLLQCKNRVHDASLPHSSECCLKIIENSCLSRRFTITSADTDGRVDEATTDLINSLSKR
jgi:hypothetical protein